jgi:MoaA/NifB/PqqE/SkfB family radical SAM enzyme
MDWKLYCKIVDEIALENPHIRVWEIFFGEPFICKDIAERVKYAKDRGLTDVVTNTNGVLMTDERARKIITAGLDAIYVGIDAFSKEVYDQIRVGGNFAKVVANVLNYKKLLGEIGKPNQQIFVQFVKGEINEHEAESFRIFWTESGINVKIRPRISWIGAIDAPNLWDNGEVQRKPCYWLMRTLNICVDGTVALCAADLSRRVNCGDVNSQSLKEVWAGVLKQYRDAQAAGKYGDLPQVCQDCRDWQSAYAEFSAVK